jgi:hypothetical protein
LFWKTKWKPLPEEDHVVLNTKKERRKEILNTLFVLCEKLTTPLQNFNDNMKKYTEELNKIHGDMSDKKKKYLTSFAFLAQAIVQIAMGNFAGAAATVGKIAELCADKDKLKDGVLKKVLSAEAENIIKARDLLKQFTELDQTLESMTTMVRQDNKPNSPLSNCLTAAVRQFATDFSQMDQEDVVVNDRAVWKTDNLTRVQDCTVELIKTAFEEIKKFGVRLTCVETKI